MFCRGDVSGAGWPGARAAPLADGGAVGRAAPLDSGNACPGAILPGVVTVPGNFAAAPSGGRAPGRRFGGVVAARAGKDGAAAAGRRPAGGGPIVRTGGTTRGGMRAATGGFTGLTALAAAGRAGACLVLCGSIVCAEAKVVVTATTSAAIDSHRRDIDLVTRMTVSAT